MRIAIVIENFDPAGGGAERSTSQIAAELARRGHAVTILAGSTPQALAVDGLTVQAMGHGGTRSLSALRRFRAWAMAAMAGGGYDATLSVTLTVPAHVVQPRSGVYREVIARNAAKRGSWAMGQSIARAAARLSPKKLGLLRMEALTVRDPMVRRFAPVSGYVRDQLLRHYDVKLDRMTVIANAAVMPMIDAVRRETWRKEMRGAWRVDDDRPVYLFAALNPLLKGLVPLLHAMAELKQRRVEVVLLVVGTMAWRFQALAQRLGVRERVRFIGPTDQMAALYCAADVTVLPTFFDPSSKVVIESLMLGVPAITTRHNGAADHVMDVTEGGGHPPRGRVIADARDVIALADAMENLSDAGERARCAAATAGLAGELSMTRHVDQLEALLQEVQ
jgi:UDP-glucose:(heptosyl)LPS alpha-1,3-glucosyltransferase